MSEIPTQEQVQAIGSTDTIKDASISTPAQAQMMPTESTGIFAATNNTPPTATSSEATDTSNSITVAISSGVQHETTTSSEKRGIEEISASGVMMNDSTDSSNKKMKAVPKDERVLLPPRAESATSNVVYQSNGSSSALVMQPQNGNSNVLNDKERFESAQSDRPTKDEFVNPDKKDVLDSPHPIGGRKEAELNSHQINRSTENEQKDGGTGKSGTVESGDKELDDSVKNNGLPSEPVGSESRAGILDTQEAEPMEIESKDKILDSSSQGHNDSEMVLESQNDNPNNDESLERVSRNLDGTRMAIDALQNLYSQKVESAESAKEANDVPVEEATKIKNSPPPNTNKATSSEANMGSGQGATEGSKAMVASQQASRSEAKINNNDSGSDSNPGDKPKRPKGSSKRSVNGSQASSVPHTTGRTTRLRTRSRSLDESAKRALEKSNQPDEIVSKYIKLLPLPSWVAPLESLSKSELSQLQNCFEIGKTESWRDDWIGNLEFAHKEIHCPDIKSANKSGPKKSLLRWAERGRTSLKILNNLIRHVCNLDETPPRAKDILGAADETSLLEIQEAIRRVSYDPVVLREDGWTTKKSDEPIGASGGPHRIGELVFWQGLHAVVIAYIHDNDLGDLWKATWFDEWDTFDLEVEELEDAKKRYERKMKPKPDPSTKRPTTSKQSAPGETLSTGTSQPKRSARFAASADFFVDGIEHGIVLAVSYSRGSRPGVFWPARVMHASEMQAYGSQNKRGSQKQKIEVLFLAPYWNSVPTTAGGRRGVESYADSLSRHGESIFNTGPLFELESVDAVEECVQPYPYDVARGLDMDQLRVSFKFSGLPKAAFSRFVDSHRLALGLKTFSQTRLKSKLTELNKTTAGLFEAHQLAVHTALFPQAVLHLPFEYILSEMPHPGKDGSVPIYDDMESHVEPALQLGAMLDSMKPPMCWGETEGNDNGRDTSRRVSLAKAFALPAVPLKLEDGDGTSLSVDGFISDLSSLKEALSDAGTSTVTTLLKAYIEQLLSKFPRDQAESKLLSLESRRLKAKNLVGSWGLVKAHGEELIGSMPGEQRRAVLGEWRIACERLYRYMSQALSVTGYGNGVSAVLSDSRCNQHRTSSGCMERAVRLPAAMKAIKEVRAEAGDKIQLVSGLDEKYLEIAEERVIGKAHSKTYLKRMKGRCLAVANPDSVVPLTEDSDGNGGEDTRGSKGTWMAALAGVGAAIKAVDMIMNGECVNVFCATRPPGHHAGRELHPMKAVSNGFCILNTVACAALYATTPVSANGPGLKRVCVIDIDVHHGNGTQDILCNTYDPRFLYVSIHAGGIDVNGIEPGDDIELTHHLGRTPKKGIFPGRCGDKSPHSGVLNIPLGARVTGHNLGTALITKVTPAVEEFSPELIIVSTGFDAHKNDPLNLGGLDAVDFGTLTEVICKLAHKLCSGRVLSVLEGGYGVPCCRPQSNWFLPENVKPLDAAPAVAGSFAVAGESGEAKVTEDGGATNGQPDSSQKPVTLLDLGEELPSDMKDELPYPLQKRLDKCHAEGFIDCVKEHVQTLAKCNERN